MLKRIIALIPAYCPSDSLVKLVDDFNKENVECVVVNDGSDETFDSIFEMIKDKVKLISYKVNQGKGHAMKEGMKYIKDNYDNCVVVVVDADGQHLVKDAINVALKADNNSLVLGVRSFNKEDVPFKSYYGNKITELVFKLFTGKHITDTQTGLRAFSYSLLDQMINIEGSRYEYEMNQLLYCVKNNINIIETKITTVYENNNESSHFHPFRDSFLIYKQLIKFSLSSVLSFIIDYLLFGLFSFLIKGNNSVVLANIIARIFSGLFNYEVNRKMVFKDKSNRSSSLMRYILLAILILALNTSILYVLTNISNINHMIAKIITEVMLFILSWTIQNKFVFNYKGGRIYEKKNV